MAIATRPTWQGGAAGVAQVDTFTPAVLPADTAVVFYITLTNRQGESHKLLTGEPTDTTKANLCTAVLAAATAAATAGDDPWDQVTVSTTGAGTEVLITADSAGEPFWLAAITSNESATMSSASATAVKGPSIWADGDNWDGDAEPTASQIPIIPTDAAYDIFGQDADTSKGLSGLIQEPGCTISMGSYGKPLQLPFDSAAAVVVDLDGTGTTYLDVRSENPAGTGVTDGTINVYGAGAGAGSGQYGLNLQGDTAVDHTWAVNIMCEANETIGIAARAGEVGEFGTIRTIGGEVTIGSAATTATIAFTQSGGIVANKSPVGVLTAEGGTFDHIGSAAMTSANVDEGATMNQRSTGLLSSGTIAGTIDFSKDLRAHVLDSAKGLTLQAGAVINDPYGTLAASATGTNHMPFVIDGCTLDDVTIILGKGGTYTKT